VGVLDPLEHYCASTIGTVPLYLYDFVGVSLHPPDKSEGLRQSTVFIRPMSHK
jgi:hypothetical protein